MPRRSDVCVADRLEAEAYRLEQEAPLLASLHTTIGADDTSTAIGEGPGRRRSRRGLVLVLLPVLFTLAVGGSWYVLGR
jgi:hypothetical protein